MGNGLSHSIYADCTTTDNISSFFENIIEYTYDSIRNINFVVVFGESDNLMNLEIDNDTIVVILQNDDYLIPVTLENLPDEQKFIIPVIVIDGYIINKNDDNVTVQQFYTKFQERIFDDEHLVIENENENENENEDIYTFEEECSENDENENSTNFDIFPASDEAELLIQQNIDTVKENIIDISNDQEWKIPDQVYYAINPSIDEIMNMLETAKSLSKTIWLNVDEDKLEIVKLAIDNSNVKGVEINCWTT